MRALALSVSLIASACAALHGPAARAQDADTLRRNEAAAADMFDRVKGNAAMLRAFLLPMPKGADLHNHLGGTPSAEDYLDLAADAGFCVADDLAITPDPCPAEDKIARIAADEPFEYARLVDHISTRGWQNGIGADQVSGHTQFFISFDRYRAMQGIAEWPLLMVAMQTAAGDHIRYLELMHNPAPMGSLVMAASTGPLSEAELPALLASERAAMAGMTDRISAALDEQEAQVRTALGCEGPAPEPACGLAVHYLASSLRALPPRQMFRSLYLSFALADADPRYVGVNIVMPEDWPVALRDYDLHMAMFRLLAAQFPDVNITMHAGELSFGQVPTADMKDHIAKAVEAGADRIGHGVDIAHETDAFATLRRMAQDDVTVEINLTSNDVILGVTGGEHPIALYRAFGVPVTLSTDDQGILRTDLTHEYQRAASEHGLSYRDLKQISRAGLEHGFLPGASLWADPRTATAVAPCAVTFEADDCAAFLQANEKAWLQAMLERDFQRFEAAMTDVPELNR